MALTTVKNSGLSGSIDLTSKVTGSLPVANGGTALTSGFVNGGALTEVDTWRKTSAMNATSSRDFLTNNLEPGFKQAAVMKNAADEGSPGTV